MRNRIKKVVDRDIRKRSWSTTQMIMISFLLAIIIGTILLSIPFATADGKTTSWIDALFTATTSVCVTGLVTVNTFEQWSIFGQCIMLVLIQLGGLGVVTFTTSLMLLIGKRVTLKNRLLLEDAFNLDKLSGLIRFLKFVLKLTFLIEFIGAVGYMIVFIPEYGAKGIWYSVFNAVSAFCNAGIDVIGPNSMIPYAYNVWINLITMLLIISGGLGFIVWYDLIRVHKSYRQGDLLRKDIFKKLNLHSKIVIFSTLILMIGGAIIIFLLEYTNQNTIGDMPLGVKILASFFQSVTTRTAGFATIPQESLRSTTALFCMILMFIGGSSVGTAGGVKTTTVAVVALTAWATIVGREEVSAFKRTIPLRTIRKAVSVLLVFVLAAIGLMIVLSVTTGGTLLDTAYETVSALATVGLTRGFTPSMNIGGKIIIILCMYLGRVGPISLAIAIGAGQGKKCLITYTKEDVTVG